MKWKRSSLSMEQLSAGAFIQISINFMRLLDDAHAPAHAMLFWRATTDGLDLFASPDGAGYLTDPALAQFGWSDCDRPDPANLVVLAGKEDPEKLFAARRLRLVHVSPLRIEEPDDAAAVG